MKEREHEWKFANITKHKNGRVTATFICSNIGCPTSISLPLNTTFFGDLCVDINRGKQAMKKEYFNKSGGE